MYIHCIIIIIIRDIINSNIYINIGCGIKLSFNISFFLLVQ